MPACIPAGQKKVPDLTDGCEPPWLRGGKRQISERVASALNLCPFFPAPKE